jgi:acyl-CoA synthetase (AMP-forming)/AMP-acid ligase II
MPFIYESLSLTKSYKGNSFYKKLFENDQIKISGKINKDDLKELLKARLPDYMVPSLFMELGRVPVTISGKIDKKALPDAEAGELLADQYVAPGNRSLKNLW